MTDREPDDLYDALRDRLTDFGQEPPAPLWASIRAQLPPPVAVPQRRRAQRQWLAALALLLVGLSTWQWWPPGGQFNGHQAARTAAIKSGSTSKKAQDPEAALTENGSRNTTAARSIASGQLATPDGAAGPAAVTAASASTKTRITVASPISGETAKPEVLTANTSRPTSANRFAATTRPIASAAEAVAARGSRRAITAAAREPEVAAVATARLAQPSRAVAARFATRPVGKARMGHAASSPASHLAAQSTAQSGLTDREETTTATRTTLKTKALAPKDPERVQLALQQPLTPDSKSIAPPAVGLVGAAAAGAADASIQNENQIAAGITAAQLPAAGATGNVAVGTFAPPLPRANATGAADLVSREALAQLGPRPVPFATPAGAWVAPTRVLPGPEAAPMPAVVMRRWAVQAVAGPALTSRTLGGGLRSYYSPTPTYSIPNGIISRSVVSTSSAGDERAGGGFGLETQLHRQLNGRWSLGAGLGYQAFATTQTLSVRVVYSPTVTNNLRPDSVGTVSVRNTYQFLTLPLRVGYQLGTGHGRLRYGLRAGADLAFYLGGRSSENSPNGSRSWGASGSPYRPLSLTLSLGAEARYRLTPGWELLAQPTLTHFATSVARPASGYVPRYPLAATALVGVAYWLR